MLYASYVLAPYMERRCLLVACAGHVFIYIYMCSQEVHGSWVFVLASMYIYMNIYMHTMQMWMHWMTWVLAHWPAYRRAMALGELNAFRSALLGGLANFLKFVSSGSFAL